MRTASPFHSEEHRIQHREQQKSEQGFTLLELLASSVLLILLFSAMTFSFTALSRGAELDEGVARFETFLRFVRAEAAHSGLRLRMEFHVPEDLESVSDALSLPGASGEPLALPQLFVERDPLEGPGEFSPLGARAWMPPSLDEFVGVVSVETVESTETVVLAAELELEAELGFSIDALTTGSGSYASLTFYPDGSSDSAEIILASRNRDDARRYRLRMLGMTGQVLREELFEEGSLPAESVVERVPGNEAGPWR